MEEREWEKEGEEGGAGEGAAETGGSHSCLFIGKCWGKNGKEYSIEGTNITLERQKVSQSTSNTKSKVGQNFWYLAGVDEEEARGSFAREASKGDERGTGDVAEIAPSGSLGERCKEKPTCDQNQRGEGLFETINLKIFDTPGISPAREVEERGGEERGVQDQDIEAKMSNRRWQRGATMANCKTEFSDKKNVECKIPRSD